ncbi:MAG: prokaryotic E2 ligase family D protein [Clostridium sp.]|nr:prokaryotic E2 ligase family D protein [Clostridium sp.]
MTETNQLTKEINSTLYPKAVLIAYTGENDRSYFLELRDIDDHGRMSEGRPVTVGFMDELTTAYSGVYDGVPGGIVPPNMLYCDSRKGSEKYIWYNPPRRRMMYFVERLNIENAEYNIPGVIYVAVGQRLNIYAFKGDAPTPDTELYEAPFFNVTGGSVCIGTANIEKPVRPTFVSLLEYLEKRFWLTEFSHLGGGKNPTKSNLVTVTKAARNRDFDLDELRPMENMKLKDILK